MKAQIWFKSCAITISLTFWRRRQIAVVIKAAASDLTKLCYLTSEALLMFRSGNAACTRRYSVSICSKYHSVIWQGLDETKVYIRCIYRFKTGLSIRHKCSHITSKLGMHGRAIGQGVCMKRMVAMIAHSSNFLELDTSCFHSNDNSLCVSPIQKDIFTPALRFGQTTLTHWGRVTYNTAVN